jgi:hypothetical protein
MPDIRVSGLAGWFSHCHRSSWHLPTRPASHGSERSEIEQIGTDDGKYIRYRAGSARLNDARCKVHVNDELHKSSHTARPPGPHRDHPGDDTKRKHRRTETSRP